VLALQAWGEGAGSAFLNRFAPTWRASLERLVDDEPARPATAAQAALLGALAAQARTGIGRVHPTWWIRALRDESPSVQRAVVEHAGGALGPAVAKALGLGAAPVGPGLPPDPDALRWVLALWDERVVRDLPEWPNDSPVILALTRLDFWEVVALARALGLAKRALAEASPPPMGSPARARFEFFLAFWHEGRLPARDEARNHFATFVRGWPQTRGWGRLGLVTFGRLLACVEPYRARWALQHLPYAVARRIRPTIKDPGEIHAAWEGMLLCVAWDRLATEGQVRSQEGLTREYRCL
jgi:hypothetical protein